MKKLFLIDIGIVIYIYTQTTKYEDENLFASS